MTEYRVEGKIFDLLEDARAEAERIMAERHDDDYVDIFCRGEEEDFYAPYARIIRENSRFVLIMRR